MHYLLGDKKVFAIEMDISQEKWSNKTAVWLNNERIGDWEDENLLAPFIRCNLHDLYTMARPDIRTGLKTEELA